MAFMTDNYVMIGRNQVSTSSVAAFYVTYQLFANRLRPILCKDNQNIFCNEYYNFRDVTYELEPGKIRIHLPRKLVIEFYKGIYPSVVEEYDFNTMTSWCTVVVPFMRDAKINNLKYFIRYLNDFHSCAWLWIPHEQTLEWDGYTILGSAPNHYLFYSLMNVMSINDAPKPISRIENSNIHNCLDLYRELLARFVANIM